MFPILIPADLTPRQSPADDGRPHFLDDVYDAAADDFADWWLDLGRVDLPARAGNSFTPAAGTL